MDEIPKGKHLNNEYDALLAVPGSFKKIMVIKKTNYVLYKRYGYFDYIFRRLFD